MKKILFLSQIYPNAILPVLEKNSKVILDYAGHNLGAALITGFRQNGRNVDVVNCPHVGSFPPYYKKPIIPSRCEDNIDSIGYVNISYFKRSSIIRQLRRKVLNWYNVTEGEKVILLYNFEPLTLISSIKKQCPEIKVALLVTDLIEFQSTGVTILKRINKFVEKLVGGGLNYYKSLPLVDAFVLLAPMMAERLKVGKRPWIVVEGVYNNDNEVPDTLKTHKRTLLYSGNLGKRYGICNLLEAFEGIKEANYELQICGSGDGLDEVRQYAESDSRIKYLGILPRLEVQKLQKAATALVNPRNSNDAYTMYSFPSKTMEYLASGTPVVMSRLKSIPAEYDPFIYYVEDESIEGWRRKMVEVCSKEQDELNLFGEKARAFIMKTKTPACQCKKIIELVDSM